LAVYLQVPEVFAFFMGALLLIEAVFIFAISAIFAEFSFARHLSDGGQAQVSARLSYRLSAVELASFAVFYCCFCGDGKLVFRRSTLSCLSTVRSIGDWPPKQRAARAREQAASPASSTSGR